MVELIIFALGILVIDLWVPREAKWINAVGAFAGVLVSAFCVWQIQLTLTPRGVFGFYGALLVDRVTALFLVSVSCVGSHHYSRCPPAISTSKTSTMASMYVSISLSLLSA